jgi:hypothetical protein
LGSDFEHAQFMGETNFGAAASDRDMDFSGAVFDRGVAFSEAHLQGLRFGDLCAGAGKPWWRLWRKEIELKNRTEFGGPLDLRGLTYERIYIYLPDLFVRLSPFDRQPYVQLEHSLRKIGQDERGNEVYLERRRVERKNKVQSRTIHVWIFDWLYKLVANYGVRPYRLVAYSLVIILFGGFLFSQPDALVQKEKQVQEIRGDAVPHLGLEVSIHYFLPMDSPIASDWIPAQNAIPMQMPVVVLIRPDWYATFLRVAGTILVGLGLAAVTGLLRRIAG